LTVPKSRPSVNKRNSKKQSSFLVKSPLKRLENLVQTDKTRLPVIQLNFGGNSAAADPAGDHDEDVRRNRDRRLAARFQLGPLYCSGADHGKEGGGARASGATPNSCHDLWLRGITQVNFSDAVKCKKSSISFVKFYF
jgi:hypothetical protein